MQGAANAKMADFVEEASMGHTVECSGNNHESVRARPLVPL